MEKRRMKGIQNHWKWTKRGNYDQKLGSKILKIIIDLILILVLENLIISLINLHVIYGLQMHEVTNCATN